MKPLSRILLLFIASFYVENSFAQSEFRIDDTLRTINFRVVDANTQEPVGLAHIINITHDIGEISDRLGYFSIPLAVGDSLRITAIGYNTKELLCWGQYKSDTIFYQVRLIPKIYEITEVKISRFSTYEKFLREVVNLKLPKSSEDLQFEQLQFYFSRIVSSTDLKNLPNPTAGIGFGEDWYHKQNKKLAELLEKEKERRIIDRKYNPGIVQKITGLSSDELYKFIGLISLDDAYIVKSSDYEIREKILKEFENYRRHKELKTEKNKE